MHELSLMENVLEIAFEKAREQDAEKIHVIKMRAGVLSGAVPEALEFAFESLAPGTPAEGARLEIERPGVRCYCTQCHREYDASPYDYVCPTCGGLEMEIRGGTELELVSLEVS